MTNCENKMDKGVLFFTTVGKKRWWSVQEHDCPVSIKAQTLSPRYVGQHRIWLAAVRNIVEFDSTLSEITPNSSLICL